MLRSFDDSSRTGDGRGGIPLYHDPHQFPEFTPNAMFGRPSLAIALLLLNCMLIGKPILITTIMSYFCLEVKLKSNQFIATYTFSEDLA